MSLRKDYQPESNRKQRKVLFPVDGSESSMAVLQWGARFLDPGETSVAILLVVKSFDQDYSPSATTQILEEAMQRFEEGKFEAPQTAFLVSPDVSAAICGFADENGIDHIVMGTHGKSFGRVMLGSISRAVMRKARQPVLIIKNPHLPAPESGKPWQSIRHHARNVLVPVDAEDAAEKLIPLMDGLLDKQAAVIHLLHAVVYDPHSAAHINSQFETGRRIIERNEEAFEDAGYWVATAEYRSGDPADVILQYAEKRDIDRIAVLARHLSNLEKLLFGSVSTALVRQDRFKVLIFSGKKQK